MCFLMNECILGDNNHNQQSKLKRMFQFCLVRPDYDCFINRQSIFFLNDSLFKIIFGYNYLWLLNHSCKGSPKSC